MCCEGAAGGKRVGGFVRFGWCWVLVGMRVRLSGGVGGFFGSWGMGGVGTVMAGGDGG